MFQLGFYVLFTLRCASGYLKSVLAGKVAIKKSAYSVLSALQYFLGTCTCFCRYISGVTFGFILVYRTFAPRFRRNFHSNWLFNRYIKRRRRHAVNSNTNHVSEQFAKILPTRVYYLLPVARHLPSITFRNLFSLAR